ncbi:MAG: hypothetical protein AABY22_11630 [Nanoarchaeota archaeon]
MTLSTQAQITASVKWNKENAEQHREYTLKHYYNNKDSILLKKRQRYEYKKKLVEFGNLTELFV